ncbi:MAG: hypothetical protein ACQEW2_17745 [Bacillota bacterium]
MSIFSRILFYLCVVCALLLLSAIIIDLILNDGRTFNAFEYLQCAAFIFFAVVIKTTMIPFYDKKGVQK